MHKEKLNEAEQAVAQHMALYLSHALGNVKAAGLLRVNPSLLWNWKHGKVVPTRAKYRTLQQCYEEIKHAASG